MSSALHARARDRSSARRITLGLGLALLLGASLSRCSGQYALVLTVKSTTLVETFDLKVKDLSSGEILLERVREKVDPTNPNRDISQPGQELKVALEFRRAGNYLIYILGRNGEGLKDRQFAIKDFEVSEVRAASVVLIPIMNDGDGDGFPDCGSECPAASCSPAFLDCGPDRPDIHPMAPEICGNGIDEDCSAGCAAPPGAGDEPCVDQDGDGVPPPADCDDGDPCRFKPTDKVSIKEAPNLCGSSASEFPTLPRACLDQLAREGRTATPPYCGDGIDQDCSGQDTPCQIDEDCDDFSPPADCNDHDPQINPRQKEECGPTNTGDGIDNNCNGAVDEGCVPCDVDGDNHAVAGVLSPDCTVPKDDPDDFDAGIFPGSTGDTGGAEGGSVLGALREFCSSKPDKNGIPARQVDHDADGQAAQDDGCPPSGCDQDGDGFRGAQCNPPPPKSEEDCDDNDPHVFPGAPDKCGDGIAQNCSSDNPSCSCDGDGDGYCPPKDDCNDQDPAIHPWATERCNAVDDDCDKLTDEGNPDGDGALVATSKSCNDDSDGSCGNPLHSGTCGCSRQQPTGTRDEGNRVRCPGENLGTSASQRCFGANQPYSQERCEPGDFDCSGQDVQPGEPFADQNKRCGTETGTCSEGMVVSCDLGQSVAHLDLVRLIDPDFNEHWSCNGVLPQPELCNGKDDDCDGGIPGWDVDGDGDKYLGCTPAPPAAGGSCVAGSSPQDLAPGLNGCGDCGDGSGSIYPGAPEMCNSVDDNCASGLADDGQSECPGSCCPSQGGCKDLSGDFFNCGTCGYSCPVATTDRCAGSSCVCGSTGGPCTSGRDCVGGVCQCKVNGNCSGCCSGGSCVNNVSVSQCGKDGAPCTSCVDGNECTSDVCTSGSCSNPAVASGTLCSNSTGRCYGTSCCTNCWTGSQCADGASNTACGQNGGSCVDCTATGKVCVGQSCVCVGCLTGTGSCVTGASNTACGQSGASCVDCTATGKVCSGQTCICNGCYVGTDCYGGTGPLNNDTCGTGGGTCTDCTALQPSRFCLLNGTCGWP